MNRKITNAILAVAIIMAILPVCTQAIPEPHGVAGIVYLSDGVTQVPAGTSFNVTDTTNGYYIAGTTGAGPHSGAYSVPIDGEDGDTVVVNAWTATHYGTTTVTLSSDMNGIDVIINALPPSAASSYATGAPINTYRVNEDVYATGAGFTTGTKADIHVVPNQDWNDGDPIPPDVTGSVETVPVVNGEIALVLIWHAPLVLGEYDIVIDADQNGLYNASVDGLDSGSPGFVVIDGASPVPVPVLTPHGIIVLIGLLCIIGMSRIRRRYG